MATATFTVTGTTAGSDWTATITNITGTTAVNSSTYDGTPKLNLITPNLGQIYGITSFGSHFDYVTWRSVAPASANAPDYNQYLFTGFSMDIWNSTLRSSIDGNATWNGIASSYTLDSNKWSLVYNYDGKSSLVYSKGGTLTVTVA
jgi:hypothetical protein